MPFQRSTSPSSSSSIPASSSSAVTAHLLNPLVRQHLTRAMRELLRIRPADPMSFLADYFTHVTTGVPAVQRAYKLIRHATGNPHFRRAEAIAEAYTLLSVNQHNTLDRTYGSLRTRHKNTSPEGASGGSKKRKKTRHSSSSSKASAPSPDISGALSSVMLAPPSSKQVTNSLDGLLVNRQGLDAVLGVDFMQLLGMRTSDFSPQVSEALCTRYMRADHAVVTWPHFKEALTVCYQYEELLEQGRALFLLLDPFNTGLAKEDICQQLIDFLLLEASPAAADVAAVDAALTSAIKDAQARGMATNQQDRYVSLASFLRVLSALFLDLSAPTTTTTTTTTKADSQS